MRAAKKEYLITLLPPKKWQGIVGEGETGKPMKSFLLVPGRQDEKMPLLWGRYSAKEGRDGQYDVVIEQLAAARMLSVEAEGYLPAISPAYKMDQSDVVFDVKLKKGTGPSGIVRGPDGKPAAGVDVALVAPAMGFSVKNGEFVSNGGVKAPTMKT